MPKTWMASFLITLTTAAALMGCGGGDSFNLVKSDTARSAPQPSAAEPTGKAITAFSADLYAQLATEHQNLVFSPYSAAIALSMTRVGAATRTAAEMDRVLHAEGGLSSGFNAIDQVLQTRSGEFERADGSKAKVELRTANALWGQQGFSFLQPFLDGLAADYGAGMRLVDYVEDTEGSRKAINAWVADQTRDRIPDLIPEGVLTPDTRLVLSNAIYLKAPWEHPFDAQKTSDGPFHLLGGGAVTVPTMRMSEEIGYRAGDEFQAVELTYVGRQLAMLVIVPDEGSFRAVEGRLGSLLESLPATTVPARVDLSLPRFEFRTQASLKEALGALGMPTAFTDDADFSLMTKDAELFIQDVVHEAFISVDEEGTEAAAATAVVMAATAAPLERVTLTVDRPFLFVIRDLGTGAPLFVGRVLSPIE